LQNVKLSESRTSDETKTTEGWIFFCILESDDVT